MREYKRLTGGQKRMWLRQHRDEILEFYDKEGEEATKRRFHLTHDTLGSLLRDERKPFGCEFTRYDRLEMKVNMAMAAVEDLRAEVRELKELFDKFQEGVSEQLKRSFLLPLLQAGIKLDPSLELKPKPDVLNIDSLISQGAKQPYNVVAEAEGLLEYESPNDLVKAWVDLSYRFEEALDNEDWRLALGMYHILRETEPILSKQLPGNTDLPSDKSR